MLYADICVAGAGIIGLSLALELHRRGARVIVVEATFPLLEASTAAAGMLAAEDPENPTQLLELSRRSLALYPQFLAHIEQLGGLAVPFQTSLTLQQHNPTHLTQAIASIDDIDAALPPGVEEKFSQLLVPRTAHLDRFQLLHEHSIDPRQLAPALLAAVRATAIEILAGSPVRSTRSTPSSIRIETATTTIEAAHFVDCSGAWSKDRSIDPVSPSGDQAQIPPREPSFSVIPIKGQMLAVAIPPHLPLDLTLRTPHFYIVPRLLGPDAGRAIIGATVEDVGFDKTVHASAIASLHAEAAALVPALAGARVLETWAGLRPATADRLPLLGAHPTQARHFVAAGHYRNGILLAPATAQMMADLVLNQPDDRQSGNPSLDLSAFSPARFLPSASRAPGREPPVPHLNRTASSIFAPILDNAFAPAL
jgi:glycine oxidase